MSELMKNFKDLRAEEVAKIALKIIKEGPICDNCLGRQFAKISSGLSNEERGRVVKETLRDEEDEEIEEGKCWVCNGLFRSENLEAWVARALERLKEYEFGSFLVGTKVSGLLLENEELLWETAGATYAEPLKAELNREVGKRLERETARVVDFASPEVVVVLNLWTEEVELQVSPVFVYGRYRKFERGLPQTRWFCGECRGRGCERCGFTGKLYAESVEELLVGPVLEEFGGEELVLHGCGREDIDARMLGSGRPFVLEVKKPRRRREGRRREGEGVDLDLRRLEERIRSEPECRGKIEVLGLRLVGREAVAKVKQEKPDKTYRVVVALKTKTKAKVSEEDLRNALAVLTGAVVKQRTPTRVLHRRADLVRQRRVQSARLLSVSDSSFEEPALLEVEAVVEIKCEGGLYIKELVSGDGGRTKPSLSELLGAEVGGAEEGGVEVKAEVKELDVLEVGIELNGCGGDWGRD